jgi:hypothetical protein
MKSKNTGQLAAIAVAIAILAVAGCGGGSRSSSASTATTTASAPSPTTAAAMTKEQAERVHRTAISPANALARIRKAIASAGRFVGAAFSAAIAGLTPAAAWLGAELLPPAAQASTGSVNCQHSPYSLSLNTGRGFFPWVTRLAAVNVPRLTEGYAPRCLVAASVAETVQQAGGQAGSYSVYGARWSAGRWSVSFSMRQGPYGPVAEYSARHGYQLVTFRGTS